MVLTASGLTAIGNIRAGDKVISTNANTFGTEEYKTLAWNKKMAKKRQDGVNKFWEQERMRLQRGENETRNWT